MEVLVPRQSSTPATSDQLLGTFATTPLLQPFSADAVAFVTEISRQILNNRQYRPYPDMMAMAHWMRPARIAELNNEFHRLTADTVRQPRGTVFHLAPANVDTLFVYSLVLALLLGNRNILRLSATRGAVTDLLLDLINSVLAAEAHQSIAQRTLVVSYGHDAETTRQISQLCSVRVIWGGDEAVTAIRAVPLPPTAREIVFPDRFSMALLAAVAVNAAAAEEIHKLADSFCNDTLLFDQLACSSPRLVVWCGTPEQCRVAQQRFWPAVITRAQKVAANWGPAVGITRMATAYTVAAEGLATKLSSAGGDLCLRARVEDFSALHRSMHSGGGMFYEMEIPSPRELTPYLAERDQTLAYFGFTLPQMRDFAAMTGGRGICRIVPIGSALNFHHVWDGMNLLTEFSRETTIL